MIIDTWQKATLNFRIYAYMKKLIRESRLPAEEVRKLQFSRLKKLLIDAYQTHPFYRDRFDACQFDPFRMTDLKEFKKVPVLEKEEYRSFINSQLEKGESKYRQWYDDTTGGSTGIPLRVLRNWDERAYMLGKWMKVLFLNGYNWRDVTFSMPAPNHLQRDSLVQRFGLLRRYTVAFTDPVENMVEKYLKVRPTVIYGNKTHLVQIALHCDRHDIELPKPRLCISFAETMDERSRAAIEKCFGAESLMQMYGAIELSVMAWQIKGEDFFNISHTTEYFEILDENGQNTDHGGSLITDLFIRSFPMIRYNLGDILDRETRNGLPVIKKIIGRQDDSIVFADGTILPWHIFSIILERRKEIKQFRVIQETYDKIRILAVIEPDAEKQAVEQAILTDLQKEVPAKGMDYVVEFIDHIPPDPNGKLRLLISNVNESVKSG
jgi:phenylacetate-coenzyme A ligase PaaK-like adenylate-forming protein